MSMTMSAIWWVGIGGFVGANARYWLGRAIVERTGSSFPWGTLVVNISGAFLIGVIAQLLLMRQDDPPAWRLFLVVGVLGGYTTFSSYTLEVVALLQSDRVMWAGAYLVASNGLGIALCLLGVTLVRRLV